jgi:hypothetical protein
MEKNGSSLHLPEKDMALKGEKFYHVVYRKHPPVVPCF